MKPEIKKALARVARYDPHYPVEKGVEFRSALADIREELERLNEDYAYKNEQLGAALLRAEKAEAEVEEVATKASHFQHDLFCEEQDRIRAEQRAEQAEAKLARWKPLIEAVEELLSIDILPPHISQRLEEIALKCREEEEKNG